MTHAVLGLLLKLHLALVPLFLPNVSGIHDAQMTVNAAPHWKQVFHTGELEQPVGAMILYKGDL